jgi:hypothetical protein
MRKKSFCIVICRIICICGIAFAALSNAYADAKTSLKITSTTDHEIVLTGPVSGSWEFEEQRAWGQVLFLAFCIFQLT